MATENNDNKKAAEQAGAAPKKKLNVVFRAQNSKNLKTLPESLKGAQGEKRLSKKQPQGDRISKPSEAQNVRRPRPLPAGTKPVRPQLKSIEEGAKHIANEPVVKLIKKADHDAALKAAEAKAAALDETAKEDKAENAAADTIRAEEAAKAQTTGSNAEQNTDAAQTENSVKAGGKNVSGEEAQHKATGSKTASEAELTSAEAKQDKSDDSKTETEDTATAANNENSAAKSKAAGSSTAEADAANDNDAKKEAVNAAETLATESEPVRKKETLGNTADSLPKIKIVKSYANYNAAEIIAAASRQARQAAGNRDAKRSDGRNDRTQRNQNGQGRDQGGNVRQGGFRGKSGENGGRTFIARGNAADGGRTGQGRIQGDRSNTQGRRPGGAGAGMAAPSFDGSSKNGGRGGRAGSGRNDYSKDRKDKFVDNPNLKAPKTGKGAFIKPEPKKEAPEDEIKQIVIPETLTIKELADKLKMQPSVIVKKLFLTGKMVTPNTELSYEEAEEIAIEYDILCEKEIQEDVIAELLKEEEEDEATLKLRNPVVCVMGHVDHGKTSLLDAIRNTNVTSREAGGITQHIGASVVKVGDRCITFLDTPGHEAFTAMRLRGAQSTDIAVLVVAADDGVKPQTIEAISHAKAAGVEVVVAINKMDKPGANADLVKSQLTEYELVAEEYGGSTPMVPVSAKSGDGIKELLDMILLEADVLELKANPNRNARGLVIEAQLDKGRGPVATVLVQKGTLKVGDNVVAGSCYGKVRAMLDDKGNRIKKAAPSYPAEILGLNDVPNAGEVFMVCEDEKEARSIAETFIAEQKKHMLEETKQKMNLDDLFDEIKAGNVKELPIIVKADVQGSVEAVKQSLGKLSNEEVAVKVIHAAAGNINESDVTLASTANAIIIGFNVKPDATAKATAEREKVDMRLYKVIYQAIDDLQAALTGMLAPVYEEQYTGRAIVRQVFKASNVGNIAGSYVTDGLVERGSRARLFRGDKQLFDGEIASLKRFKDEVKEVKLGFECGIVLEDFSDIQVDDTLEFYKMVQVARTQSAE